MKKRILYTALAFILVSISVETKILADTINPDLNEMTDVRIFEDEERNEVAANEILERLSHIDDRILKNVNNSGARLILSDAKLVDLPEFSNLKGVIPRGHTEPWDEIPGLGGYISYVAIGKSEPSVENNHGDINLELHEFGHIVDMYAVPYIEMSQTDEFIEIHAEEKEHLFPENAYFDYRDEYFAEAFAYYYLTEESRKLLYQDAPRTAKYLEAMHNKMLTVSNVTTDSFQVEWDNVEEASYYTVVLNEETSNQSDTSIQFETLMGNTNYEVQVFAKNEKDEIVEESYPIDVITYAYENVDDTALIEAYNHAQTIEEEKRTDHLISLEEQAEEMFDNIYSGRISQDEVNQLAEDIEKEIKQIDEKAEEVIEEDEAEASEQEAPKEETAKEETKKDESKVEAPEEEAKMPTKEDQKPSVLSKVGWVVILGLVLAIVYIIFISRRRKGGNKR